MIPLYDAIKTPYNHQPICMCSINFFAPQRSAVGGSFILHTSEFTYETEIKDRWARTKPISLLQCTGGKNDPLHESLCVLQKHFVDMFQLCRAKLNHFSYSLYIAQTRYTKYWSIRGVCVSHPTLSPRSSSENTIQRLHNFSIKHLELTNSWNQLYSLQW